MENKKNRVQEEIQMFLKEKGLKNVDSLESLSNEDFFEFIDKQATKGKEMYIKDHGEEAYEEMHKELNQKMDGFIKDMLSDDEDK